MREAGEFLAGRVPLVITYSFSGYLVSSREIWPMIKLTRLDGKPFILNADLIRYVEERPDTFVTLTSGERILVSESMDQVVDLAVRYQQNKHLVPNGWRQTPISSVTR